MKKELMFAIGSFSLLIAIILGRFGGDFILSNFLEGMFSGISLVMNLSFLIRFGSERRKLIKSNNNYEGKMCL